MIMDFFVIELDDGMPQKSYFSLDGSTNPTGIGGFTNDAPKALKFYDKRSAEQFIKSHLRQVSSHAVRKEIGTANGQV